MADRVSRQLGRLGFEQVKQARRPTQDCWHRTSYRCLHAKVWGPSWALQLQLIVGLEEDNLTLLAFTTL